MNIHDEGVAIKAYLMGVGRWEAIEWERVHAWIDAVVAHHAPVTEHVVLETPADPTPADEPTP